MASSPPSLDKGTGSPVLLLILKKMLSPLLMILLLLSGGNASRCEILADPFCKDIGYKHTMFPNYLNHTTYAEAQLEMSSAIENLQFYHPSSTCYQRAWKLICWMFFPPCSILGEAIPPCREMCEGARESCQQEWASGAARSGSAGVGSGIWPEKCDVFPENSPFCLSIDWPSASTTETPTFAGNMSWTNTSWLSADSGLTQQSGNATFLPDPTWNFNFTDSLPMSTGRPSMSTTNVPDLGPFQAFWSALSQAGAVEEGSAGEMPVQVITMMAEMFARFGRIQQLQEEKLGLEIRLLQRELMRG